MPWPAAGNLRCGHRLTLHRRAPSPRPAAFAGAKLAVLRLDEPTASLDAASTRAVEALLPRHVAHGLSVSWMTHPCERPLRVTQRHFQIVLLMIAATAREVAVRPKQRLHAHGNDRISVAVVGLVVFGSIIIRAKLEAKM